MHRRICHTIPLHHFQGYRWYFCYRRSCSSHSGFSGVLAFRIYAGRAKGGYATSSLGPLHSRFSPSSRRHVATDGKTHGDGLTPRLTFTEHFSLVALLRASPEIAIVFFLFGALGFGFDLWLLGRRDLALEDLNTLRGVGDMDLLDLIPETGGEWTWGNFYSVLRRI